MKVFIKYALLLFFSTFFLTACERDDEDIKTDAVLPTSVNLIVQEGNDSLIASWQVDKGNFEYFEFKIDWQLETGPVQHTKILLNGDKKRFATLPFGDIPLKSYKIIGYLSSGDSVVSNIIETYKPELYPIQLRVFDAVYKPEDSLVYLFSRDGLLVSYNLIRKRVAAFNILGKALSFADMGNYGGNKELYLPSEDGNLYIMDGKTLELKDQINVGNSLFSVAASGDYLFLKTGGSNGNAIKVYSRSQKTFLGSTGNSSQTRLIKIPGSSDEILEFSPSYNTIRQATLYTIGSSGSLSVKKQQEYPHGTVINEWLAQPYPDGSKIIVSNSGIILNRALQLERVLSTSGNQYISFCYHSVNKEIFAANGLENKIDVFDNDGATLKRTVTTVLYPRWIFYTGSKIVVLGSRNRPGRLTDIPEKLYYEEIM